MLALQIMYVWQSSLSGLGEAIIRGRHKTKASESVYQKKKLKKFEVIYGLE